MKTADKISLPVSIIALVFSIGWPIWSDYNARHEKPHFKLQNFEAIKNPGRFPTLRIEVFNDSRIAGSFTDIALLFSDNPPTHIGELDVPAPLDAGGVAAYKRGEPTSVAPGNATPFTLSGELSYFTPAFKTALKNKHVWLAIRRGGRDIYYMPFDDLAKGHIDLLGDVP